MMSRMDISTVAGIVFGALTAGVVAFQVALALGAPWGAYAMGGGTTGSFPPAMRVAAVVQAVLLALLGIGVLSAAGVALVDIAAAAPWVAWLAVGISALALVLNSLSRSAGERRIWVPVAAGMLISSLLVATAV